MQSVLEEYLRKGSGREKKAKEVGAAAACELAHDASSSRVHHLVHESRLHVVDGGSGKRAHCSRKY
jgi:hypothetical protein